MTWTYSNTLATNRDMVRLKIGDTDTNDQLLQNETIDALLTARSNSVVDASIDCVRAVLAVFVREIDRSNVGITANRSQKFNQLETLLQQLQAEARTGHGGMFVGGHSRSEKETIEDDTDFLRPFAKVGKDDFDNQIADECWRND